MHLMKHILQLSFVVSFSFNCTGKHVGQFCQVTEGIYGFCQTYSTCRSNYPMSFLHPFYWTACGLRNWPNMIVCCPFMEIYDCGLPYSAIGTRITKGQVVMDSSWPWMVALGVNKKSEDEPQFLCGGTLISPTHVLTAAHCAIGGINIARVGNYDLADPSVMDIPINRSYIHPNYYGSNTEADIAVLELRHTYNTSWPIRPICLPGGRQTNHEDYFGYPNQTVYVAGWGATMFGGRIQKRLMKLELNIVDLMTCNATYRTHFASKFPNGVKAKTLCAADLKSGPNSLVGDACLGDSGSPLIYRNPKNGRGAVIGIVSRGHGCGIPGVPGLYTRVVDYLPWLTKIMSG